MKFCFKATAVLKLVVMRSSTLANYHQSGNNPLAGRVMEFQVDVKSLAAQAAGEKSTECIRK